MKFLEAIRQLNAAQEALDAFTLDDVINDFELQDWYASLPSKVSVSLCTDADTLLPEIQVYIPASVSVETYQHLLNNTPAEARQYMHFIYT